MCPCGAMGSLRKIHKSLTRNDVQQPFLHADGHLGNAVYVPHNGGRRVAPLPLPEVANPSGGYRGPVRQQGTTNVDPAMRRMRSSRHHIQQPFLYSDDPLLMTCTGLPWSV